MSNDESRRQFEEWIVNSGLSEFVNMRRCLNGGDEYIAWDMQLAFRAWQAASAGPDAATVALHFGYEVTKIRDQVFIAKNNACGKVWIPFSRDSHPQVFMEYEKCN